LTMSVTSATTAVRARTTTLRVTRSVAVLKRLSVFDPPVTLDFLVI
jgi:hypothetical protein